MKFLKQRETGQGADMFSRVEFGHMKLLRNHASVGYVSVDVADEDRPSNQIITVLSTSRESGGARGVSQYACQESRTVSEITSEVQGMVEYFTGKAQGVLDVVFVNGPDVVQA